MKAVGNKLFKSKRSAMAFRNSIMRGMGRAFTKIGGKKVYYPKGSSYLRKVKNGWKVYWYNTKNFLRK